MRGNRFYLGIAIALLLMMAAFTCIAFAQAKKPTAAPPPQGGATQFFEYKIKPGMGPGWEAFVNNDVIPLMEKGGIKEVSAWKTAQFGEGDTYWFLVPLPNLASLDTPPPWMKDAGPEVLAGYAAKIAQFVVSARAYMVVGQPQLTIEMKPGYAAKMGVVVTNVVSPGREQEFEKISKQVMAATGKTNAKGFLTSRILLGGNPNEYQTFVPFDSFADMDKFGPAFAKAQAEVKLIPGSDAGVVTSRMYTVVMNIPELSIQAPASKPAK